MSYQCCTHLRMLHVRKRPPPHNSWLSAEFLTAIDHLLDDEPPQLSGGAEDKHRIFWLALPQKTSAKRWLSRAFRAAHAAARGLQEERASPEHCGRHAQRFALVLL